MNFDELLRSRRSVRRFRAEVPTDELIERLLERATCAPSASNKQPWRFIAVKKRATIAQMAEVVRRRTAQIERHVPADSRRAFHAYGEYFTRFEHAPVVVVPIFRGHTVLSHLVDEELEMALRGAIQSMERDSGLTGTALALMLLLLAAHEAGLGASAMTGPLVAAAELAQILGVPASWGLVALVALGYPAETPKATDRKPVAKVLRWIR